MNRDIGKVGMVVGALVLGAVAAAPSEALAGHTRLRHTAIVTTLSGLPASYGGGGPAIDAMLWRPHGPVALATSLAGRGGTAVEVTGGVGTVLVDVAGFRLPPVQVNVRPARQYCLIVLGGRVVLSDVGRANGGLAQAEKEPRCERLRQRLSR